MADVTRAAQDPAPSADVAPSGGEVLPSRWKDRVRGLERVRAGDLVAHPWNWRTHTTKQAATVMGALAEVGKCQTLIAFPADGLGPTGDFSRLMLLNGHLRQGMDLDELWPVTVTDLTRVEADKMLAILDPSSAMAGADPAQLEKLLERVTSECAEIEQLLIELANEAAKQEPQSEPDAMASLAKHKADVVTLEEAERERAALAWEASSGDMGLLRCDCPECGAAFFVRAKS